MFDVFLSVVTIVGIIGAVSPPYPYLSPPLLAFLRMSLYVITDADGSSIMSAPSSLSSSSPPLLPFLDLPNGLW